MKITDYPEKPETPLVLHENRRLRVIWNGFYHYVELLCGPGGAIALIRNSRNEFAMVRQRRMPVDPVSLEFPRGGLAFGEIPREGAAREAQEETGFPLGTQDGIFLGCMVPDSGITNFTNHMFYFEIPEGMERGDHDDEEIQEVIFVKEEDINDMIRNGKIGCGQSLAIWGAAWAHGLLGEMRKKV